ncbi:MAG TPA: LPS export ABC transporter periplasmic protein LptC [Bacteroidales bacterium]|nr:LPS export ABC transporter periplasmic protein LptC [Bacteroidales bacterium]
MVRLSTSISIAKSIVVLTLVGATFFFASCKGDSEAIVYLSDIKKTPGVTAYNSEVIYTEEGKVALKVLTPETVYYQFADEPHTVFPKGITVYTYDNELKQESSLTANYAIYYEKKMLWQAKNNVVAKNRKGEQLYTEELYWDQNKHIIYTNVNVKINSVNGIIYGKGLIADETFDIWEVKEPYDGEFEVDR